MSYYAKSLLPMANGSTVVRATIRQFTTDSEMAGVVLAESYNDFVVWTVHFNHETGLWESYNGAYFPYRAVTTDNARHRMEMRDKAVEQYRNRAQQYS